MKKTILLLAACLCLSIGYAQNAGQEATPQVGDTVVINEETGHYLTGEKIPGWVYKLKHTIPKRFRDGCTN